MANQIPSFRADTGKPFKQRTGFNAWLRGNPEQLRQFPRYSPEISQNVNELLGQGFQNLQDPYQGFQNISDEAIHRYQTQDVPSLAERFTSLGGGQRSSAFQNALSSQGQNLERSLAAMKEGFGQENRNSALKQILLGLQNQPQFSHTPRQRGWLEGLLGPLASGGPYQGSTAGQEGLSQLIQLLPFLL